MKKTCSIFALILLLAMSLCTPALAASEYGVIYDETDELGSATLTMQGEQTLPELSETLGIDLRVDVLTQISYDSIADAAAGIYARYGYGYGEEREGATGAAARPWPMSFAPQWSPLWPSRRGTARTSP